MTDVINGGGRGNALVDRVKNILLKPNEEWPKIEAEPTTTQEILTRYVLPLAAIGPIATFIGSQVFGYGALGFTYRPSLMSALSGAVITFILTVVGVFVLSLVADFLAPKFDGQASKPKAFKLVAYSWTAGLLAGVFGLIPSLAFLAILGLYSIYLLYTGATPLMKVPQDKAIAYTAVTIVCAIMIYIVVGALTRTVVGAFIPGPTYMSDSGTVSGTVNVPGVGKLDLAKAQKAADEMEAAANGRKPAVDPARLQALLPAEVGGYARTAVETNAMGAMGSEANGTYTAGGKSFRLKITDMAAVGALAGLGSAMGVSQSRADSDGYERTATANGRMQTEKRSHASGSGAASIDELKHAVASVNEGALARLAG